jgi:hypothetical protein
VLTTATQDTIFKHIFRLRSLHHHEGMCFHIEGLSPTHRLNCPSSREQSLCARLTRGSVASVFTGISHTKKEHT